MIQRLYNSKYEIEPRMMLLAISAPDKSFTEDQMVMYDFMTVYAHEFSGQGQNLHGDNGFKYSEFSARKQAVSEAIKALVKNGMLQVVMNNGFQFRATESGINCFSKMESSYALEYTTQLKEILKEYSNYSEGELHKLIRAKALKEEGRS